jgi:Na+/H+ antiporter NhaD/arsenite permease-like protein
MHELGLHAPLYAVLPFALLLLAIAVMPLAAAHWWEHNRNKALVGGALSLPVVVYLLRAAPEALAHSLVEYGSFVALLGALYVVAGGIRVTGDLRATPLTNTLLLGAGAVLANLIGTTGASMVLIRTVLRTNQQRSHTVHIPFFFILVVSNCGGLLTPLGDPPLFIGYLRGVPFTWTLQLWPIWLGAIGYLLALFHAIDRRAYARESAVHLVDDALRTTPLGVEGGVHVGLLALVVGAVFLPTPWREAAMVGLAAISAFAGPRAPRIANGFSWAPIVEVAVLFLGIFVTMVPALAILEARGSELGLTQPWQFFLTTGALSSVLDNAPTYLTFLSTAQALGLPADVVGVPNIFLVAISTGAVLMGANTYIGNGPNFMVKAIAEEAGVKMPSFFRYALGAVLVLSPIYVVLALWLTTRA